MVAGHRRASNDEGVNRLLRRHRNALSLTLFGGLLFTLDMGCGRAVLFDGTGGSGASSASNSNNSNNSASNTGTATNSTSTGVVCGCEDYCADLPACGIDTGPDCVASCQNGEIGADELACVCKADNCDEIFECEVPSVSVVTSTGVGGGLPVICEDCIEKVAEGPCEPLGDQCITTDGCGQIVQCMVGCGWGNACETQCVNGPGPGITAFYNLMACLVCNNCSMECSGTPISEICF